MNIKCEKPNEALKATCIIQTAQSLINGFVMSGKGHRGNTVDTKEFPFAKHRIGNVHLMFMTKDKAIQRSKTTTLIIARLLSNIKKFLKKVPCEF